MQQKIIDIHSTKYGVRIIVMVIDYRPTTKDSLIERHTALLDTYEFKAVRLVASTFVAKLLETEGELTYVELDALWCSITEELGFDVWETICYAFPEVAA